MIFVTLGTQDKSFDRLLKAIDKEIENGNIKEKVIVQAGYTKYESHNMEIFDLLPAEEFEKYFDEADLIITHGGVGSILSGIKKNKKVIAAARLSKYKEHTNDHQKQIIEEFSSKGYILELKDFNKLGLLIQKSSSFKPKKFESNTENMVKLIENYIKDSNNTSWFNKYRFIVSNILFLISIFILNIIGVKILELFNIEFIYSSIISLTIIGLLVFIINKWINNNSIIKRIIKYLLFVLIYIISIVIFINIFKLDNNITNILSFIISSILYFIINIF